MTAGTRRNGASTFSFFKRGSQDGETATQHPRAGSAAERYAGRHADPRGRTARKRAGRVVPAAAVAAALVIGGTAYGLVASGGHGQTAQLSADMALPGGLSSATRSGVGVDSTASTMIRAGSNAGRAVASASAKPQASRSPQAAAKAKAKAAPSATAKAAPTHSTVKAAAAPSPTAKTLSCDLSGGLLPDNVTAIVSFLLAHGYSDNAAAGIAGNMYQESKGNPESEGMGGGGLIGFTRCRPAT